MEVDETAASWDLVKSRNRAIESSNHRVLERSAAEAVACKLTVSVDKLMPLLINRLRQLRPIADR